MGLTLIEWATYTHNEWIGCTKIKPECDNCYAAARDARHLIEGVDHWGALAPRYHTSEANRRRPHLWNRRAMNRGERDSVFCGSQMDWAEKHPSLDGWRVGLFETIDATPSLDWLMLTKRPGRIERVIPERWLRDGIPPNVWFGTSAGCQSTADALVAELVKWHGRVSHLFVSAEPLLGHTDLRPWLSKLSWVITGGESGPRRRAMSEDAVRSLRDQCEETGTAFFYKQKIVNGKKVSLPVLDGRTHADVPRPVL